MFENVVFEHQCILWVGNGKDFELKILSPVLVPSILEVSIVVVTPIQATAMTTPPFLDIDGTAHVALAVYYISYGIQATCHSFFFSGSPGVNQ
jgi:hypothetical protein